MLADVLGLGQVKPMFDPRDTRHSDSATQHSHDAQLELLFVTQWLSATAAAASFGSANFKAAAAAGRSGGGLLIAAAAPAPGMTFRFAILEAAAVAGRVRAPDY